MSCLFALQVAKELDREKNATHELVIKASEDCLHAPTPRGTRSTQQRAAPSAGAKAEMKVANSTMMNWEFDPKDDTLLRVIVKVLDVNDNPPKFVKRVFTGGVTTEADFGTEFMQVLVSDQFFQSAPAA